MSLNLYFQAHAALDSVYYMCVKDISVEQLGQVRIITYFMTSRLGVIKRRAFRG